MRNASNQLKIHVFDDYLGYRVLIDEVNVWVLPDIGEEPGDGLTLKSSIGDEKAIESYLEEGCYYPLFDVRSRRSANQEVRERTSHILLPTNLICHTGEQYQRLQFLVYGLSPHWHHTKSGHDEKPAGLETLTTTYHRNHIEHQIIAQIMKTSLAQHQVQLNIQKIGYDQWYVGEIVSDVWLNSTNFTLPLNSSLFAHLCGVPLL